MSSAIPHSQSQSAVSSDWSRSSASNILERQLRLAVYRCRYENIADRIGKSDCYRQPIVVKTRVEVDLRQPQHIAQHRFKRAIAS